jgi:hypothetical protein
MVPCIQCAAHAETNYQIDQAQTQSGSTQHYYKYMCMSLSSEENVLKHSKFTILVKEGKCHARVTS